MEESDPKSVPGEDGYGVRGPAGARARFTELWVQDRTFRVIAKRCLRKISP